MENKQNLIRFSRYYQNINPLLAKTEVRAYAMIIFSLITISFFGYFALKPTFTTITLLNRQVKDAILVNQQLQRKINSLSLAQTEYQTIKPDLDLISQAIPSNPQFPLFVKSLEKIATQSGVTIKNVNFQSIDLSDTKTEATDAAMLTSISFNINLLGDYPQINDFITKLSSLPRIVVIDKMGFSKKETVEGIVVARVFFQP